MLVTPKEIVAFRAKDGGVPFEDWLDDLKDMRARGTGVGTIGARPSG